MSELRSRLATSEQYQDRADSVIRELQKQLASVRTRLGEQVIKAEQRWLEIERLQQRQSPQGELLNTTPESQTDQSEPLVAAAPVGGEDVDIADDRNTLKDIPAPATPSSEPVEAAPGQGRNFEPLTATELAERLGVAQSNISRNKDKGNEHFRAWSTKLDPDGIAWEYRPGKPRSPQYHPLT